MNNTATLIRTDGTTKTVSARNGKRFELDELQKFVGGSIELVRTGPPRVDMWVNEDGIGLNLPRNDMASLLIDPAYSTLGGLRGDALLMNGGKPLETWKLPL